MSMAGKRYYGADVPRSTGPHPDPLEQLRDQGRCVLDGYFECAAKIPEACICAKMPKDLFLERLKKKYGE